MKKMLTILFSLLMVLSCTAICSAAEESKAVLAKYICEDQWTEVSVEDRTETTVELPDGTKITVDHIPGGAMKLFIYPIPKSQKKAWTWIENCFEGKRTPIHAFDIYFADESGNRMNANGAVVTIVCSHCSGKVVPYSLTINGTVKELNSNIRSDSVTFTTDGSHYYVMTDKISESATDDEQKTENQESAGKKADSSAKIPKTGDNSRLGMWFILVLISAVCICTLMTLRFRRRKRENRF